MAGNNAGQFVVRGRPWHGKERYRFQQGDKLSGGYGGASTSRDNATIMIRYGEQQRKVGKIGPFDRVEHEKWIRSRLHIGTSRAATVVAATAAGVKSALRRIREQESERLDELDTEIEELTEELRRARLRRTDALREAFNKGHVVRLAEVVEHADQLAAK